MFNFTPFPQLITARLLLRQLATADVDAIAALRSNDIVNRFLDRPKLTHPDEALAFINKINNSIQNNQSLYWGIALKENNHLIGAIGCCNFVSEEAAAEIGYELHPDFFGQGLMQEALTAVIDFCYRQMQLRSINAFTVAGNIASIKLLERNNFTLVPAAADAVPDGRKYVLQKTASA